MDKKTTSWVSYITWIGWLIAYCSGDKEGAKFYLNQSLLLNIFYTGFWLLIFVLMFIPFLGWLVIWGGSIFLLICFILGLVYAINQEEKELPLIGKIRILK